MHVLQHNREHLHLDELISEGSLAPGQDSAVFCVTRFGMLRGVFSLLYNCPIV
uniref:Uncharacterized protein n=1 Tax=Magallana gigas TaxID=29159 RepID=K1PJX6_MAGGI